MASTRRRWLSGKRGPPFPTCRQDPSSPDRQSCQQRKRPSSSHSEGNSAAARRLPLCPAAHDPHLTRSSLHRCLQRHGISQLQVEGEASAKRKFKAYPIGYFHIDIAGFEPRRANSTCSSPSIGPQSSPSSSCTRRSAPHRGRLPAPPDRRRSSRSIPFSPTTEPIHHARQYELGGSGHQGRPGGWRARLGARLRIRLRPERHRSPADKAQASMDPWASRKNEPHDQGRDCQTLLPRPTTSCEPTCKTSSTPTTSPDASKPSEAYPIRIRRQSLDFRTSQIQTQSAPANAGTKHLGCQLAPSRRATRLCVASPRLPRPMTNACASCGRTRRRWRAWAEAR